MSKYKYSTTFDFEVTACEEIGGVSISNASSLSNSYFWSIFWLFSNERSNYLASIDFIEYNNIRNLYCKKK